MLTTLRIITPLLYAVGVWYYFRQFRGRLPKRSSMPSLTLVSALATHSILLVMLYLGTGHIPLGSVYKAMAVFTWLFCLLYLLLEVIINDKSFGLFVVPVVLLLQTVSSVFIDPASLQSPLLDEVLFEVHVIAVLISYAAFALGAMAGIMYLLLFRQIREQNLGLVYSNLPSLPFLDEIIMKTSLLGFIFLTAGLALGVFNAYQVLEGEFPLFDPKTLSAFITWLVYGWLLFRRVLAGREDKGTAWLSIIGFSTAIFAFLIVNMFMTSFHLFR